MTTALIAWAFAFAAVWAAWWVSERRTKTVVRAWCAFCAHYVPGDLIDHLADHHPDVEAWCIGCQRSVPVTDVTAHRRLMHTARVQGPEDQTEWKDA